MSPVSWPELIDSKLVRESGRFSSGRCPGGKPFEDSRGVDEAPETARRRALDIARLDALPKAKLLSLTAPGPASKTWPVNVAGNWCFAEPSASTSSESGRYHQSRSDVP